MKPHRQNMTCRKPQPLAKDERGSAVMEMAEIGTLLAILLPAFIDLVMILDTRVRLAGAVRAGEQYAMRFPDDSTGIQNAVLNANDLNQSQLTVTTSQFCECAGASAACGQACTGGGQPAKFVSISASYNLATNFTYAPLITVNPVPLSSQIDVRVQ